MYVIPPKNKATLGRRTLKTVERYSVKPHKIHEDVTINIAKGERNQPPATPVPYPGQQLPFPGQPARPGEQTIPPYVHQDPTAPVFIKREPEFDDDDDNMEDEGSAPPFDEMRLAKNVGRYLRQKGTYGHWEEENGQWVYVLYNRDDHGDIIKTEYPQDEGPTGLVLTVPYHGSVSSAITPVDSGRMDTRPVAVTVKQEEGDQLGIVTESKDLSPFNTSDLLNAYRQTLQIIIPNMWQCINQRYLTLQGSDTKRFAMERLMLEQMMNDLGEMSVLLKNSLDAYEEHDVENDSDLLQTLKVTWQEFNEKYRVGKEYQKALQDIDLGESSSDSALQVLNDIAGSITRHYLVTNPLVRVKENMHGQFSDYITPHSDLFDTNNRSIGARAIDRLTTLGNKIVSYLPIVTGRDDAQYTDFVKPYVDAFCNSDGITEEINEIPESVKNNYLLVMNDLTASGTNILNPFEWIKAAFNTSNLSLLFSAIIGDSVNLTEKVYNDGVDDYMSRARSIVLDCVRLLFTMAYGVHNTVPYFEGFQKYATSNGFPYQRLLMNEEEALKYPRTIPDSNIKGQFGILQTLTHIIVRYPSDIPFTRAVNEMYYYRNSNINNRLTPDFVWEIIRKNLPLQRLGGVNYSVKHQQQFSPTGFGKI